MTGSFVSDDLRRQVRGIAVPVAKALGRAGLTPNALTVIGFAGTCAAALAAAGQAWILAGILLVGFGIFDLFDGALARATGTMSRFGAFLDSTLDRTGENLVYAGIAVAAADADYPAGVAVAVLALAFASVVTYSRAKAEVVGLRGDVGFAPREIRLLVLAAGLIVTGMTGGVSPSSLPPLPPNEAAGNLALAAALGVIALLSAITIVQRIFHVKRELADK